MSEMWNLSYGYVLLEAGIPAEKVTDKIAAWFRHDYGADVGADNPVTEKAARVIRKWESRDKGTTMVSAGNWADTRVSVYNFEPFGARPGDLVYIHDHCGDREDWQDYTIDVKAKLVGLVQDWTNGILKAACIVTGDSIQFAKGERVVVPAYRIRPRKKRK